MDSPWIYEDKELTEAPAEAFGFVYRIVHVASGRSYIGKKQVISKLSKKVAGKRNRKHFTKESAWREYWGSSDEFKKVVEEFGKSAFRREILKFCATKRELSYGELEEQVKRDVLTARLPDGTRAYFNGNIANRYFATREV